MFRLGMRAFWGRREGKRLRGKGVECLVFAALLIARTAKGTGTVCPPDDSLATTTAEARLYFGYYDGFLPVFRVAERSAGAAEAMILWHPEERLRLGVQAEVRQEHTAIGENRTSLGGVRLEAMARLWEGPVQASLGWQAAVPWTADRGEVGSDETDVALLGRIGKTAGSGHVQITGGLAILGNPLRFANQDDIPLLWLSYATPLGAVEGWARAGGGLGTARNPARISAAIGGAGGCPLRTGGEVEVGLSPAAADWGGRLWVGWAWGCAPAARD